MSNLARSNDPYHEKKEPVLFPIDETEEFHDPFSAFLRQSDIRFHSSSLIFVF